MTFSKPKIWIFFLILTVMPAWGATDTQIAFFESKIRPILAERCFECHSHEEQESGLRLDHIEFIMKGGERGSAIEPGNPDDSNLVKAIEYFEPKFQMPPKTMLEDEEIDLLIEWVAQGAPWPDEPLPAEAIKRDEFDLQKRKSDHWAWQPIQKTPLPEVRQTDWPLNDADTFILAKLEEAGLAPSTRADRHTLIRRLYFDLIGLPPTPDEVTAFVEDKSPKAYEKLVDQLLASPHFGERWGRHWLDLTRFSETFGHEADYPIKHAWPYRDYVIRALNDDVPYDRFAKEHIAGDLAKPRIHPDSGLNESIIGTGWWYMHQATHAPVDVLKDEADRIDNQIDVFGKAFMGLTIACARCHDHKFDAITAKDYYSLTEYLRNSRQVYAMLDPDDTIKSGTRELTKLHRKQSKSISKQNGSLNQSIRTIQETIDTAVDIAEKEIPSDTLDPGHIKQWAKLIRDEKTKEKGHILRPLTHAEEVKEVTPVTAGDVYADFNGNDFGDWFVYGEAFGNHPTQTGDWSAADVNRPFTPAGVAHSGLVSKKLQGVLRSQTFILNHDRVQVHAAGRKGTIRLIIGRYQLHDYNGILFGGAIAQVNTKGDYQWFDLANGIAKYKGRHAYIEFVDHGDGFIAVDEMRFSNTAVPKSTMARQLVGGVPVEKRTTAYQQKAETASAHLESGKLTPFDANWLNYLYGNDLIRAEKFDEKYAAAREKLNEKNAAIPNPFKVLAITEGSFEPGHVHIRGNPKEKGVPTPRRFLEALNGPEPMAIKEGSGRLELAESLFSDNNPLPARVMVNRIWHHVFGRGIVQSTDNFGVLGIPPTHPELLDHLASQFIESGWSVKTMIRDFVTSQTYQMTSTIHDSVAEEKDPSNLLHHRRSVKRIEGEIVRDTLLAVSDNLDRTMYGESIPAHYYDFMTYHRRFGKSGPVDGANRRSIYQRIQRNFLSPMMLAFDMPLPDSSTGKRTVSNVPAQSLIMMNDPFVIQQSKSLGKKLAESEGNSQQKVERLFNILYGRSSTLAEFERIKEFGMAQSHLYSLDEPDWAHQEDVMMDVVQSLFMAKEFIFIG
jgi:hypothetical protein